MVLFRSLTGCILDLSSTPDAFAGVRAALPFLPPFSLRSWAEPNSLILSRTALCAAAFPLVTPLKVAGECSGPTGLAGRYCHNGDSQNRKSSSVCLVWVSLLLKQPDRSFDSDILYGISKPICQSVLSRGLGISDALGARSDRPHGKECDGHHEDSSDASTSSRDIDCELVDDSSNHEEIDEQLHEKGVSGQPI